MRFASSSVVNDCVRHSHWLYGVWYMIVYPIELISRDCCMMWMCVSRLDVNVCDCDVYLDEMWICVSRLDVCVRLD